MSDTRAQLAKVSYLTAESIRCAVEDGSRQRAEITCACEIPECAGTLELAVRNVSGPIAFMRDRAAARLEIVEAIEKNPRTKLVFFAHELACRREAPPHCRSSIGKSPHGDYSRCRIPSPEPFVLICRARHVGLRLAARIERGNPRQSPAVIQGS
jgi:hypothetical protein